VLAEQTIERHAEVGAGEAWEARDCMGRAASVLVEFPAVAERTPMPAAIKPPRTRTSAMDLFIVLDSCTLEWP